MTPFNNRIFRIVKDEITSYDRYENHDLIAIVRKDDKLMVYGAERFGYAYWVNNIHNFTSIKVSGGEKIKALRQAFKRFNILDIQIFYSAKSDWSFDAHCDPVNVYLYVIKGRKKVKIRNKFYIVRAGQGIVIPKGHKHQVLNESNTWALSVAYK